MFSLVTQADGSVRRHPLVSYFLFALIAGVFAYLHFGPARRDADEVNRHLETVVNPYFEDHPYLEVDSRFAAIYGADQARTLRDQYIADREAIGLSFLPDALVAREQQTFDRLVEQALHRMETLPAWRFGVRDQRSPPVNILVHTVIHDGALALVLSLFFVLLIGIALEDVWGSLLFSGFCALTSVAAAVTYAAVYGHLGLPWNGASGLVAGLLGAYVLRSIRWPGLALGAVPLPGWLMLTSWLGAEYLVVRELRPDTIANAPWIAHAASFGVGLLCAFGLRQLGAEKSLRGPEKKSSKRKANPVLDKAMAAHRAGRSSEGFELLLPEFERSGRDRQVALGLWEMAQELQREAEVVTPLLTVVQDSLRRRVHAEAAQYWLELTQVVGQVEAAPAFLVRIGEALLEEDHEPEALAAFGQAVDAPQAPTPVMLRVVRAAQDRDAELTQRAAARALSDAQLDPLQREKLRPLAGDTEPEAPAPAAVPAPAPEAKTDPASPFGTAGDLSEAAAPAAESEDGPTQADGSSLDPNALDMSDMAGDAIGEVAADSKEKERWNDPGLVEDLSWELPDDEVPPSENEAIEDQGLDPSALADTSEAPGSEGDSDPMTSGDDAMMDEVGGLRTLKLKTGVPLVVDERGLKLETDDGGKSRVSYDRLEALGVAVVDGLDGGDAVHIVDVVLNWMAMGDEPLKVIRMRSDCFDASRLYPDASSREDALRRLIGDLLDRSDANPLPSADAARGQPFATFDSLESYERTVLLVSGPAPDDA